LTDTASGSTTAATCLGCGCACDDIEIVQRDGRIVEARQACALGAAWFGDGAVPARARVAGNDATLADALDAAAALVTANGRPLVYLAPDLSCEAQRAAVALADALGASVDSITSATALPAVLAAQERGRATATLGEIRQRADVVVFWGVDPNDRYPRFSSRYAPEAPGLHVAGRRARTVIAVDVDAAVGPVDADIRLAVARRDEVALLTAVAAISRLPEQFARSARRQPERAQPGEEPAVPAAGDRPAPEVTTLEQQTAGPPPTAGAAASTVLPTEAAIEPADEARPDVWATAQRLASSLTTGRYVAIVADAEPAEDLNGAGATERDRGRAAALIALAQTLNGATRAALVTLRAGGNRAGADAVLTWQTGYPAAVDLSRGYPRYRPADGTAGARLARGEIDFAVVLGSSAFIPERIMSIMSRIPCVAIGPRASDGPLAGAAVVIDSGVAGIHEGGMAFRMDDVPLPLQPVVAGPPAAALVLEALVERVVRGGVVRGEGRGHVRGKAIASRAWVGTTGSGESVQ
jgi:formylmethanofuran dehydrogenase subunit B